MRGMEHYAPRKYRGPETWALVRDAYLSGGPAKLVCQRFDVSYANLRAKASREGWTRRVYADATDVGGVRRSVPPLDPRPQPPPSTAESALETAMARASDALIEGHAGEASAILKAAETFARLSGRDIASPIPTSACDPEKVEKALIGFMEDIWKRAEVLAHTMMSDDRAHIHSAWASRNIYAWRAEHFGPEVAAADYAYAKSLGACHHEGIWDETGALCPPTPPGQMPSHMVSAYAHYGPSKKRQYPGGTEDEP